VDASKILAYYAYKSTDGFLEFEDYLINPNATTTTTTTMTTTTTATKTTTAFVTNIARTTLTFVVPSSPTRDIPPVDANNPNNYKITEIVDKIKSELEFSEDLTENVYDNIIHYYDLMDSLNNLDIDLKNGKDDLKNAKNNKVPVYDETRGSRFESIKEDVDKAEKRILDIENTILTYEGYVLSYIERINWYIEKINESNNRLLNYYSQLDKLT